VDGRDLRDYPVRAWRRRVAAIFQDFVRYELPVRENVGFGAVELLHDDERIFSALDRAGARQLVDALPQGLETTLTRENADGAELSGGQWQRLAIARALLAVDGGAAVLVLDEPTANLDPATERELLDAVYRSAQDRATLVITHRLVRMQEMDEILVLERGRIVERGTHTELEARHGTYRRMLEIQREIFVAV
jgi:ATP-binding cassette subfamily B protein